MKRVVFIVVLLMGVAHLYAATNRIFGIDWGYTFDKCETKFANVNACLKIAEAISSENDLPEYLVDTICEPLNSENYDLLGSAIRNINENRYRTEDMVKFIKNIPNLTNEYGGYSYCCSYKDGKIVQNDKPYEFDGNIDSLKIYFLHPLERMMSKLCQEELPDQISDSLDSYMDYGSKATLNIYNWFRTKNEGEINYLYALFSPFDNFDGLRISHNKDTLFIYGNYIRHEPFFSNICSINTKMSDYYIFYAIAQGYCYYHMPSYDFQDELLICAVSDALYMEYLDEMGINKETEKEWIACRYHKYNITPIGKDFESFVDYFHSIYAQKKYKKLEELCKEILFEHNRLNKLLTR